MFNQFIAFVLNNLLLVAAGGLVAAYLTWRMWQKVESLMRSINSWGELFFWAGRLVVIVAFLFFAGRWIYGTINQAVIAAVNSPSIQTAGQSLVDLGGAVDQLVGFDGGGFGGNFGGDLFSTNLDGAIDLLESTTIIETEATDTQGNQSTQTTSFEMKPLEQLFQSVTTAPVQPEAVNASIGAPAHAPVAEYVVQPGDSINKIAKRLGIDAKALCKANGLSDCSIIRVGQALVMPGAVTKALNETTALETTAKLVAPRPTPASVYTQPKRNQSYLPPAWNVIETGQMSVGAPANMSTNSGEVLASFVTK
jgi:LysM repeat protein